MSNDNMSRFKSIVHGCGPFHSMMAKLVSERLNLSCVFNASLVCSNHYWLSLSFSFSKIEQIWLHFLLGCSFCLSDCPVPGLFPLHLHPKQNSPHRLCLARGPAVHLCKYHHQYLNILLKNVLHRNVYFYVTNDNLQNLWHSSCQFIEKKSLLSSFFLLSSLQIFQLIHFRNKTLLRH